MMPRGPHRWLGVATLAAVIGLAGAAQHEAPAAPAAWPAPALHRLGDSGPAPQGEGWRLMHFWARWCAPCRHELPALQRLAPTLQTQGTALWTVALDDDDFGLREYLAQRSIGLPVLRPDTPDALAPLQLASLPQTWLIAPDGRIAARWVGERDWDAPAQRHQLQAAMTGAAPR